MSGQAVAILGKGGTGKTTTTATLGALFAAEGRHVRLVDLDSTPALTRLLAPRREGPTVDDVLGRVVHPDSGPIVQVRERLSLVCSSTGLARIEGTVPAEAVRELVDDARQLADVVLLDLRGGAAARLAAAAVAAADLALVTLEPSPIGIRPLSDARRLVADVDTNLAGVLPVRGSQSRIAAEVLGVVEDSGVEVWPRIRQDVAVERAAARHRLLDDHAPSSRALADYRLAAGRLADALKREARA